LPAQKAFRKNQTPGYLLAQSLDAQRVRAISISFAASRTNPYPDIALSPGNTINTGQAAIQISPIP
jgi:hypothetical protein